MQVDNGAGPRPPAPTKEHALTLTPDELAEWERMNQGAVEERVYFRFPRKEHS